MRAASTCLLLPVYCVCLVSIFQMLLIVLFEKLLLIQERPSLMPRRVFLLGGFWCLPALKKKIIKGLLSVGRKNPSLFLYPYRTPHPQAGDSNQTLPWAHLWSWKIQAWKSPPCWLIEKGGFGGPTWKVEGVLFVFVHRWVGSETAVHSEEPLLKAIIFFLIIFSVAETTLEDL